MTISPGIFLHFFKILIFLVNRAKKGKRATGQRAKKEPKMTKKLCLYRTISQERFIIWLSFMVQICKMVIYSGVFFCFFFSIFQFFKILIFWVVREIKGQKNGLNWQKICLLHFIFQERFRWFALIGHDLGSVSNI